jgi:hypothetical protein
LVFLGFTQLLSALLVNQVGDHWYTSYSLIERIHALLLGALSVLLGGLILRQTLDLLRDNLSEKSGIWIRYLMLTFVAIALYKSQALVLNGRYLSMPYSVTYLPVFGMLGFMLSHYGVKGNKLLSMQAINDFFGEQTFSLSGLKKVSLFLVLTGLVLIGIEMDFIMHNSNYEQAYPLFMDRIYATFMVVTNFSQLMGWVMVITGGLLLIPFRISAYALLFMVVAIVAGEAYAFIIGHDFIENYPNLGERIWISFVYTITNQQLLAWLGSLLILAWPFWRYQEPKVICR